jgi:DNA-binding CsgD family transcriptional regulator
MNTNYYPINTVFREIQLSLNHDKDVNLQTPQYPPIGDNILEFSSLQTLGFCYIIVDYKTSTIEGAGGNTLEIIGLDRETLLSKDINAIFDHYPREQKNFYYETLKWQLEKLQQIPIEIKEKKYIINTILPLTISPTHKRDLLIIKEVLEKDLNNNSSKVLLIYKDIKYLLKDNTPWCRMYFYGGAKEKGMYMHAKSGKFENDILTNREKEILGMIENNYDTKEIAEKLFLSPVTINNHRANMLLRTGARDTTALAQLARLCGIL